jgi:carbonic anhydrase/acetyltransferase-like protein (isoleucine patch superfamily)
MALYEFEGKRPKVGKETYVSETADVIGDVTIGDNCYIGPGARIKGDYGTVKIGSASNVQENCIIHARPGEVCTVGDGCSVGHGSILHNCTIKNRAKVGMGAIVSDYAVVGEDSVVGEGCVVRQHQEIPPRSVAVGVPAKVIGELNDERLAEREKYRNVYPDLAKRYLAGLKRIE